MVAHVLHFPLSEIEQLSLRELVQVWYVQARKIYQFGEAQRMANLISGLTGNGSSS